MEEQEEVGATTGYSVAAAENGKEFGGAGGNSRGSNDPNGGPNGRNSGGGAGNPSGLGWYGNYSGVPYNGSNGTGGLLILYSSNIYNLGDIFSNGSQGGDGYAGGGSSGGGSINIFCKNNYINRAQVLANGGIPKSNGGAGGNGSVTIGNISTGTFAKYEE